ncbi:MAG: hypothetical protein DMG57_29080 [Acidobacteria bacterium]|nr:MAG: hypothetical protein DMG57_29080 [Acidobacteriota bacterium]
MKTRVLTNVFNGNRLQLRRDQLSAVIPLGARPPSHSVPDRLPIPKTVIPPGTLNSVTTMRKESVLWGRWQGRGAELLGLSGDVKTEQFEALRQGCGPNTGEFLRQRQSVDRMATDGTTQSRGNLYDFTISAPKSVSIMASLGKDDRLIEAHWNAVDETVKELEACAQTRVRQDGANEDRDTGNLVLAVYQHDTSRELDPQLHTHAVAANLTYDGTEDRWKALQASEIYERRAYLTEVYRNALARCALSDMRLRIVITPEAGTWDSRSRAFLGSCCKTSASGAPSAIGRLRSSCDRTAASHPITKWPSWCGSRGSTSRSKSQPTRCEGGRERG